MINLDCKTEIKIFEKVNNIKINYKFFPRRAGDLPVFWADATRALNLIEWKPGLSIEKVCEDTWRWQSNNPNGYNESK